jgi:hypothetical protein
MDTKPTDLHPALTDDRLRFVANIIRDARHECVIRREAKLGDNGWAVGCRAYAWVCHAVTRATLGNPWLTIVEGGGHIVTKAGDDHFWTTARFVFAIGSVPLRFYRGEADDVPANSLRVAYPELEARKQAFLFEQPSLLPNSHALRLAIETDEDGEVSRVTLVQVLDAAAKVIGERWTIYDAATADNVAPFTPRKEEGKDLGKPAVGSRKKKADEERGEE